MPPAMAEGTTRGLSLKDAFVQVGLITVGVLIALSFDGIVAWRRDRALVRDARANLLSEIRDNRQELQATLTSIDRSMENGEAAIATVQAVAKDRKAENRRAELGFRVAELQNASRSTAEVTGAFALMKYEEVKTFTALYARQDQFLRLQEQALQSMTSAFALIPVLVEPEQAAAREFDDLIREIRAAGAGLFAARQWGDPLLKEYDTILASAGAKP
jgi:hypothetical protein